MNPRAKKFIGIMIVLLPVFILVAIWVFMVPLATRFADFQTVFLSLGRISGLIGLGLFAVSLMLHKRITIFSKFLDTGQVVRLHHQLGSWALIFLLIHPLVLAARFVMTDIYYAAKFLVPVDNLVNFVGLVALLVMIASLLVTYYYKGNHVFWKWVHRAMLIAYVGAFLHLLFITSDTSSSLVLKYYMIFLMTAGMIAFIYQRMKKL